MNKVLLISHMPPPTTGIGSWTKRVIDCGVPGWSIGFVNSNMIGGRDPFHKTRINLKDEIQRSIGIWSKELKGLKADEDYRIVHTNIPCTVNGMLRETVTGAIAKICKRKFIVHCHCTLPNVENTWFKIAVFKLFSTVVDGYIVLNNPSKEFVERHTNKGVKLIPNFVCENELPLKMELNVKKEIKNALFVGGVSPEKGCDTILEAAKYIPDIDFHLVGVVSDEISKIDLPSNVHLYGNRDKEFVKAMMSNADVFLFLSRFYGEGFSVALVEAMANGLPCIVTNWAANADMILPDGGVVIPQKSPDSLVRQLKQMSLDEEMRRKASYANIKKVKDFYISNVVLDLLANFYNEILREG